MAEDTQEASSINYQKTVAAQKERTTNVEKPMGFVDTLLGKHVSGRFESSYQAGRGGSVVTSIRSGLLSSGESAAVHQSWEFDGAGDLTGVTILKTLPGFREPVGKTVLEREADGKFRIKEHKVDIGFDTWERQFNAAAKRLKR